MMRARHASAALSALAVSAAIAVGGCFSERSAATGPIDSAGTCRIPIGSPIIGSTAALVAMQNFAFQPDTVRVRAGTTVTWVNCETDGVDAHTSTSDDDEWDSPFLDPGASYSRTFAEPGRYDYHCVPHPFMRGVVIVE